MDDAHGVDPVDVVSPLEFVEDQICELYWQVLESGMHFESVVRVVEVVVVLKDEVVQEERSSLVTVFAVEHREKNLFTNSGVHHCGHLVGLFEQMAEHDILGTFWLWQH